MSTDELTTTSYALLGQLSLRSWSAYELTQQMQRASVRVLWPRAESRVYDQLKRLAKQGYATVSQEPTGRRPRSMYTITDAGRAALAAWLDSDGAAPFRTEDELVLRLSHGDVGTVSSFRRNLQRARRHLLDRLEPAVPLTEQLARGEGRFPHRAHISALMAEAVFREVEYRALLYEWIEAATEDWADMGADDEKLRRAQASLDATAARMRALLDEQRARLGPSGECDGEDRRSGSSRVR